MTNIIIYGTSNWAKLVYAELRRDPSRRVAAFACDDIYYHADTFLDCRLYRFSEIEKIIPPGSAEMLVCGVFCSPRERYAMYQRAVKKGYACTNFISVDAMIADTARLGENNFIFGGVYIDNECVLGHGNIIRPNAYLGHNSRVGNGVYISPGVNIGGYCRIDDLSFIGIGSNVIARVHVGREVLVGAGSLVLRDAGDFGKYFGSPARRMDEIDRETGIIIE